MCRKYTWLYRVQSNFVWAARTPFGWSGLHLVNNVSCCNMLLRQNIKSEWAHLSGVLLSTKSSNYCIALIIFETEYSKLTYGVEPRKKTLGSNAGLACCTNWAFLFDIFFINMLITFTYLYILLSLHWCVRFWMLCCFLSSLFCIVYGGQLLFVFDLLFVQFDPCRCELGAAQCLFIVWTYLPWNNNLICIRYWFNIFLFVRPMSDTCQI